ncbi:Proprotein convertase P-domain-containing protein [Sulfidibacter corallicola]|uniref:Proprotein convertase P-domain-containing protein n=1 Tax=Sulfidibacter corallicola TaxID=2818388 RepID=A0A8A4TVZ0_SULCO|nr:proprotein convertase P-domain-containing protein [Sulfidibacter corallicola]QTD53338.1 proprotein convertase P-domain-containing protein [Sulfidibacter corallicola]
MNSRVSDRATRGRRPSPFAENSSRAGHFPPECARPWSGPVRATRFHEDPTPLSPPNPFSSIPTITRRGVAACLALLLVGFSSLSGSAFAGVAPDGPPFCELDTHQAQAIGLDLTVGTAEELHDTRVDIPDANQGNPGGRIEVPLTLNTGSARLVSVLEVEIDITHTWRGDLSLILVSPQGTEVVLKEENYSDYRDDWRVTYGPGLADPVGNLSDFDNQLADGNWVLKIRDHFTRDRGHLNRFRIKLALEDGSTVIVVSGAQGTILDLDVVTRLTQDYAADVAMSLESPAGTRVTLTSGNGGSFRDLFDGTRWDDQADEPVSDAFFTDGQTAPELIPEGALGAFVGEDPNGSWTLHLDGGPNGLTRLAELTLDFTTVDPLPDLTQQTNHPGGGGTVSGSRVIAEIDATNLEGYLCDVDVTTAIQHPSSGELILTLRSPGGSVVLLSSANGGNHANVFDGTLWDDDATDLATDYPYQGLTTAPHLIPEGALSKLIGENPNGVWTLEIEDTTGNNDIVLQSWSLTLTTCTCPPTPAIVVIPSATPLITTEEINDLETASISVVLSTQPSANVVIPVSSSDESEGIIDTSQLVFTAQSWDRPQTVTLGGVDDDQEDGDRTYSVVFGPATSADLAYQGLDPEDVAATNVDNDRIGVVISARSSQNLIVTETPGDAEPWIEVHLTSRPASAVLIPLSSSSTDEGIVEPVSLQFDGSNWARPVRITIRGMDDDIDDGDRVFTVRLGDPISADPDYNALTDGDTEDLTVTNRDNDTSGLVTPSTALLETSEAGDAATIEVRLNSQPTATVILAASSSVPSEAMVEPASLNFDAQNWDQYQTITVSGLDDAFQDASQNYTVTLNPSGSGDATYALLESLVFNGVNLDDDVSEILVEAEEPLRTVEDGTTARFTVRLGSRPYHTVTLPILSTDTSEGSVSPAQLVFTGDDWDQAREVVVTGLEDEDLPPEGTAYEIVLGTAQTDDTAYEGLAEIRVAAVNFEVNSAPRGAEIFIFTARDTASPRIMPTIDDPDPDDSHTWELLEGPNPGQLTVDEQGFLYTPAPDFLGYDAFRFRVTDRSLESVEGSGVVIVVPPIWFEKMGRDWPSGETLLDLVTIINDPTHDFGEPSPTKATLVVAQDGDLVIPLRAVVRDGDAAGYHGDAVDLGDVATHGGVEVHGRSIVYEPDWGFRGVDRFSVTQVDETGLVRETVVRVLVQPREVPNLCADARLVTFASDLRLPVSLAGHRDRKTTDCGALDRPETWYALWIDDAAEGSLAIETDAPGTLFQAFTAGSGDLDEACSQMASVACSAPTEGDGAALAIEDLSAYRGRFLFLMVEGVPGHVAELKISNR